MANSQKTWWVACIGPFVLLAGVGCTGQDEPAPSSGVQETGVSQESSPSVSDKSSGKEVPEDAAVVPEESAGPAGTGGDEYAEVRGLLTKLVSQEGIDRSHAQRELDGAKLDNEVFLELLEVEDPLVRQGAAYYLAGRFLPQDVLMQKAFLGALADENAKVRGLALQMVARMPAESVRPFVPRLVAMLDVASEQDQNRAAAARFLGRLKIEWRLVLPALVQSVKEDPVDTVRKASLYGVSRIALPAEALPVYRQVLNKDSSVSVKRVAVVQLGRLGQDALAACPDLGVALAAMDDQLSDAAAEALTRIGPGAVPELIQQVSSPNIRARQLAIYSLGAMGPPAKSAIPRLKECLADKDAKVRQLAEMALRQLLFVP